MLFVFCSLTLLVEKMKEIMVDHED